MYKAQKTLCTPVSSVVSTILNYREHRDTQKSVLSLYRRICGMIRVNAQETVQFRSDLSVLQRSAEG